MLGVLGISGCGGNVGAPMSSRLRLAEVRKEPGMDELRGMRSDLKDRLGSWERV